MNLCKSRHWKKVGVVGRKRPPSPVCLYQRRRHLEIWRCQNENSAFAVLSWRHSRDVPSGFAPLPRRAAECWKKMPVSLMYSRPHRCGIYAFDCSGVKECGHVQELSILLSTSLVTVHIITLFLLCFSQVSSPDEGSETHGPKQATSGSITGRPGAIRWRLTTRVSHLIVTETLCLSSTATLCRCSITCWCNCKCRPITGRIKYSLT